MKIPVRHAVAAASIAMSFLASAAAHAEQWYPLKVRSTSADGTASEVQYSPLPKASKPWSICVSLPHMKDPFFLAADYGLVQEAKRMGVKLQVLDAGGYTELANQVSQVENCVAGGAQAVVLAAIARDGLNNLVAELKKKNIPVIDAINGVSSTEISARVLTIPHDEGMRSGEYLAAKHPAGSKPVKVGWLPGPAGAGFVEAFTTGFKEGIKGSAVEIAETKNGDVGKEVQARLVEDLLQTHKDLDYIVGTAVTIEAAVPILRERNLQDKVKLVSLYMTPGVMQALKSKRIDAADSAPVVLMARILVDTAVRAIENKIEYRDVGVMGLVYTPATAHQLDPASVLAPADFRPVFKLD